MSDIRCRIVGFEMLDPAHVEIRPSPWQWKDHSLIQTTTMKAILGEIGITDAIKVRKMSENVYELVDGHLRTGLLEEAGIQIPALVVDLDEGEAAKAIATHDTVALILDVQREKVDELVREVSKRVGEEILPALDVLQAEADRTLRLGEGGRLRSGSVGAKDSSFQLKGYCVFPSSNEYGIPDLLPEQLIALPEGIKIWSGPKGYDESVPFWFVVFRNSNQRRLDTRRAYLSFYTFDEKFVEIWDRTAEIGEQFLSEGWLGMVAPNFSVTPWEPRIENLYAVYRSRWVARYMQGAGLGIIPDVDWADETSFEFNLLGLPQGLPSVCVQLQTTVETRMERAVRDDAIRTILNRLNPSQIVIYGASPREVIHISHVLPDNFPVIHVNSITRELGKKLTRQKSRYQKPPEEPEGTDGESLSED